MKIRRSDKIAFWTSLIVAILANLLILLLKRCEH